MIIIPSPRQVEQFFILRSFNTISSLPQQWDSVTLLMVNNDTPCPLQSGHSRAFLGKRPVLRQALQPSSFLSQKGDDNSSTYILLEF